MNPAGELISESWDEYYAMWDDGGVSEPVEPCGCQGWLPVTIGAQPTQEPAPVTAIPDDDRCFSCGTTVQGNDHYCPVRGGYV